MPRQKKLAKQLLLNNFAHCYKYKKFANKQILIEKKNYVVWN